MIQFDYLQNNTKTTYKVENKPETINRFKIEIDKLLKCYIELDDDSDLHNKPNSDNKHDLEAIAFAELNQENKNYNVLEELFIKLKNYIKLSEYM